MMALAQCLELFSGVAGATNNQQHYVLISGLAGPCSLPLCRWAAGAYLAAKKVEAEVYEAEISREAR